MMFYLISQFGSLKSYLVSPFTIQTHAKFWVFLTLPVWLRKLAQKWCFGPGPTLKPFRSTKVDQINLKLILTYT